MNTHPLFAEFRARFQAKTKTRILAFSNTDRYYPGMYWLDVLDLTLQNTYGRIHHCINTSVGGQTTADMLERFDEDAAFYQPHLVFITIGGGEGHPGSRVTPDGFAGNLRELHRRFAALGCAVVFQTYYALDPDRVEPERLKRIYANMDIVRATAAATGAALIDHLGTVPTCSSGLVPGTDAGRAARQRQWQHRHGAVCRDPVRRRRPGRSYRLLGQAAEHNSADAGSEKSVMTRKGSAGHFFPAGKNLGKNNKKGFEHDI
jgi:hypothetical protein